MEISIKDKQVHVADVSGLKPYQISQLIYFGFGRDDIDGTFWVEASSPTDLLVRLVDYISGEEISFELSSDCAELLKNRQEERERILALASSLAKIKKGQDLRGVDEFSDFVKKQIKRNLKQHQLKAAFYLYASQNGANFSVPGSGKTSVVLTVYEKLRQEEKANLLFVVGPPSCFGPWKNEYLETLGRLPIPTTLAGRTKEERIAAYHRLPTHLDEVYLITYQTLANDISDVKLFFNQRGVRVFFVVDEAHYVKQRGGIWADAVLQLGPLAVFRCVLTGTPLPNSYADAFNLFDFLWGKDVILDSLVKLRIVDAEQSRGYEKATALLKEKIDPFFFRVRKTDLGLKDQVFLPPCLIKMNEVERKLYEAILTKIRSYAKDDYLKNVEVVKRLARGRMMRLRQCVSYARMLTKAIEGYEEGIADSEIASLIFRYDELEKPAKISYLLDLIDRLRMRSQKVVIWSTFVESIRLISRSLTERGYYNKCIYGDTPTEHTSNGEEETRELIRDEFVRVGSGLDVLVANPAACAESISLHKTCQNAIYYDLSYNCAQYLQSLDRIHRVGGSETKEAFYHFLQYEQTIDLDIKRALERKSARMSRIIDEDCAIYSLDMFEEDEEELRAYEKITREQEAWN